MFIPPDMVIISEGEAAGCIPNMKRMAQALGINWVWSYLVSSSI
jgi:hypothetical protein